MKRTRFYTFMNFLGFLIFTYSTAALGSDSFGISNGSTFDLSTSEIEIPLEDNNDLNRGKGFGFGFHLNIDSELSNWQPFGAFSIYSSRHLIELDASQKAQGLEAEKRKIGALKYDASVGICSFHLYLGICPTIGLARLDVYQGEKDHSYLGSKAGLELSTGPVYELNQATIRIGVSQENYRKSGAQGVSTGVLSLGLSL